MKPLLFLSLAYTQHGPFPLGYCAPLPQSPTQQKNRSNPMWTVSAELPLAISDHRCSRSSWLLKQRQDRVFKENGQRIQPCDPKSGTQLDRSGFSFPLTHPVGYIFWRKNNYRTMVILKLPFFNLSWLVSFWVSALCVNLYNKGGPNSYIELYYEFM